MLIETEGGGVFGVDEQGENAEFDAGGAEYGIRKEDPAEFLSLMITRHCEATEERGGDDGIARQFAGDFGGEVGQGDAGGGEGIEAGDLAGFKANGEAG